MGFNAANIAAIAVHTAPSSICEKVRRYACVASLCVASLPGLLTSLFGSAGLPIRRAGNPPRDPLSLSDKRESLIKTGAGRKKFPVQQGIPFREASAVPAGITRRLRRAGAAGYRAGRRYALPDRSRRRR